MWESSSLFLQQLLQISWKTFPVSWQFTLLKYLFFSVFVRNIPGASSKITSILVFWGVRDSDFGEYTCGAKNEKGAGTLKFQLQSE